MSRPYIQFSIEQIEAEYAAADQANDVSKLKTIAGELEVRKTPRAKKLRAILSERLKSGAMHVQETPKAPAQSVSNMGAGPKEARKSVGTQKSAGPAPKPTSNLKAGALKFPPTAEQEQAIKLFQTGGSLKINAYAGTGKTSTLEMLAQSTNRRGQYLAFNSAIVKSAKKSFPDNVHCATIHSLAFKATPPAYKTDKHKCFGKVNANQLAETLKLKKWQIDKDNVLTPRTQGALILSTIRAFAQSSDPEIHEDHVRLLGNLQNAPEQTRKEIRAFAMNEAQVVWARMLNEYDALPLGHDGYLKLWSLSKPTIAADFIMLDEAQDTNPVALDVLKRQSAQLIYVGDKHQQIYEWRGAVNAMERMKTDHETRLTQSFRFGPLIAQAASAVLRLLREAVPLRGNPKINSSICNTPDPDAILARTNGSVMEAVFLAIEAGRKPHLIGSVDELKRMLRGVIDLKANLPSEVPDFWGFENWNEVVEFAKTSEGEHLQTFTTLVEMHGEKKLLWALNRTVGQDESDLTISTVHKAKGCEWSSVRLMDDFLKSTNENGEHDLSELRLFYVAVTRAKERLEIAPAILGLLGR